MRARTTFLEQDKFRYTPCQNAISAKEKCQVCKIGLGTKSPRWNIFVLPFLDTSHDTLSGKGGLQTWHFSLAQMAFWHGV